MNTTTRQETGIDRQSMEQQPPVVIVIVHWGDIEVTRDCLLSLKVLRYPNYRVLVIDNGTGEVGGIAADFPGLEVISLPDNIGFSPAANLGIEWSVSQGGVYTWLLNNDAEIRDPFCLSRLVSCAGENGSIIVTPVVQNGVGGQPATRHEIYFPGLGLTFHDDTRLAQALSRLFRTMKFISGAAMFVRLDKAPVPFFDSSYFAYYEDLDVCLRLGESELKVCDEAAIFHKVSASTSGNLFKHFYKARNLVYFLRKHHRWTLAGKMAYWLLFIPMEARKYRRHPLAYLKTTIKAFSAGRQMAIGNDGAGHADSRKADAALEE